MDVDAFAVNMPDPRPCVYTTSQHGLRRRSYATLRSIESQSYHLTRPLRLVSNIARRPGCPQPGTGTQNRGHALRSGAYRHRRQRPGTAVGVGGSGAVLSSASATPQPRPQPGRSARVTRFRRVRTLALLTKSWEPTTTGTAPPQATSSHYRGSWTVRQATPSIVQARFENAS